MNKAWSRIFALMIGVMILLFVGSDSISAQSDTVEIFRGKEGPYEAIVGIVPNPPMVGTVHIAVTLVDAETSLPATKASVTIIADNDRGQPTFQVRALNAPSSPETYRGNITFDRAGEWSLRIRVESEGLERATLRVPLLLQGEALTSGMAGTLLWVLVVLVLFGGGLYVWYSSRRHRRASSRIS